MINIHDTGATDKLLDAALAYTAHGWRVFPCKPRTKKPLTSTGFHDAQTLQSAIESWWTRYPDANIGMCPGQARPVPLVVVDLDGPEADDEAARLGLLAEPTLSVWTPRGEHRYYRHPGGTIPNVRLGAHIDVRGDAGYVLLPPSVHPSGARYRWVAKVAPIALPPQVLEAIKAAPALRRTTARELPPKIAKGERNPTLTSLAGSARRRGASRDEILGLLRESNRLRCVPPLSEKELVKIAESVSRYAPSPDGAAAPRTEDMLFTPIGDLLAEPEESLPWLLDGVLPSGGLSILGGKPKAGKSTLARALAVAVAQGENFLGRAVTQGPAFYLALEDKRAKVRQHFQALGATAGDPLYVFTGRAPADAIAKMRVVADRERPALIVVDTIQRLIRVRDVKDYALVAEALDPLLHLARDTSAHVLFTHHVPKVSGEDPVDSPLGSISFSGTVDTVLELKRRQEYRTLRSVQRYGEDLEETVVRLEEGTQRPILAGTRRDYEVTKAREAILEHLKAQTGSVEQAAIREAVEARTQHVLAALRGLVEEGKVIRSGRGVRNDPLVYELVSHFPDNPGKRENESEMGRKPAPDMDEFISRDLAASEEAGNENPRGTEGTGTGLGLESDVPPPEEPPGLEDVIEAWDLEAVSGVGADA